MKLHYWVKASTSDFAGSLPQPRSGHSAVAIGKSKVVVFGGLVDKSFLGDIIVYDFENQLWFKPECTGSGVDGHVGPSPRAFHVSVSIDCHMFIFGGRFGSKRLGDFWVLDTDIWQWSELTSFGDLPSPRDFSAAASIGTSKIVMFGGWDGKKWLSDVFLLDTISLEWKELSVSGAIPPPRCGHTATMVEKRLLVYGGRGGGGPIMGDLWALKGLIEEENETPGWTHLKLPGQAPLPRCGHTVTSGGHYLLVFGGHGTGGWLSRYDIYYNDCTVLDRVSAQWKLLPIGNESPPARAYHTVTSVGTRHLLIGGFDGKSTFGDLWWLVPEGDPLVKRLGMSSLRKSPINNNPAVTNDAHDLKEKESQSEESSMEKLSRQLGIEVSFSGSELLIVDELEDSELVELACGTTTPLISTQKEILALRERWKNSEPSSIRLKELGPLLRDYQRLIVRHHLEKEVTFLTSGESTLNGKDAYIFYHMKNATQLRMDDIPRLLSAYKQLKDGTIMQ